MRNLHWMRREEIFEKSNMQENIWRYEEGILRREGCVWRSSKEASMLETLEWERYGSVKPMLLSLDLTSVTEMRWEKQRPESAEAHFVWSQAIIILLLKLKKLNNNQKS